MSQQDFSPTFLDVTTMFVQRRRVQTCGGGVRVQGRHTLCDAPQVLLRLHLRPQTGDAGFRWAGLQSQHRGGGAISTFIPTNDPIPLSLPLFGQILFTIEHGSSQKSADTWSHKLFLNNKHKRDAGTPGRQSGPVSGSHPHPCGETCLIRPPSDLSAVWKRRQVIIMTIKHTVTSRVHLPRCVM